MAGPNLEVFKFAFYLFFPIGIMAHFADPQWYDEHVAPYRSAFWPDEETLVHPPKDFEGVKTELAAMKAERVAARQRQFQEETASLTSALANMPRNVDGNIMLASSQGDQSGKEESHSGGRYGGVAEAVAWPEKKADKPTPRELRAANAGVLGGSKWV